MAVTFLLFELETSLLKEKRAKKLSFILKIFAICKILGFKRDTAIFVDFGTFFARFFSPLKRARLVPMTSSGENLMFRQPPIVYKTFLGTPSVFSNRPRKIFGIFFSRF